MWENKLFFTLFNMNCEVKNIQGGSTFSILWTVALSWQKKTLVLFTECKIGKSNMSGSGIGKIGKIPFYSSLWNIMSCNQENS